MLASIFPLFARAMYKKMTFSGASSFLGALVSPRLILILFITLAKTVKSINQASRVCC